MSKIDKFEQFKIDVCNAFKNLEGKYIQSIEQPVGSTVVITTSDGSVLTVDGVSSIDYNIDSYDIGSVERVNYNTQAMGFVDVYLAKKNGNTHYFRFNKESAGAEENYSVKYYTLGELLPVPEFEGKALSGFHLDEKGFSLMFHCGIKYIVSTPSPRDTIYSHYSSRTLKDAARKGLLVTEAKYILNTLDTFESGCSRTEKNITHTFYFSFSDGQKGIVEISVSQNSLRALEVHKRGRKYTPLVTTIRGDDLYVHRNSIFDLIGENTLVGGSEYTYMDQVDINGIPTRPEFRGFLLEQDKKYPANLGNCVRFANLPSRFLRWVSYNLVDVGDDNYIKIRFVKPSPNGLHPASTQSKLQQIFGVTTHADVFLRTAQLVKHMGKLLDHTDTIFTPANTFPILLPDAKWSESTLESDGYAQAIRNKNRTLISERQKFEIEYKDRADIKMAEQAANRLSFLYNKLMTVSDEEYEEALLAFSEGIRDLYKHCIYVRAHDTKYKARASLLITEWDFVCRVSSYDGDTLYVPTSEMAALMERAKQFWATDYKSNYYDVDYIPSYYDVKTGIIVGNMLEDKNLEVFKVEHFRPNIIYSAGQYNSQEGCTVVYCHDTEGIEDVSVCYAHPRSKYREGCTVHFTEWECEIARDTDEVMSIDDLYFCEADGHYYSEEHVLTEDTGEIIPESDAYRWSGEYYEHRHNAPDYEDDDYDDDDDEYNHSIVKDYHSNNHAHESIPDADLKSNTLLMGVEFEIEFHGATYYGCVEDIKSYAHSFANNREAVRGFMAQKNLRLTGHALVNTTLKFERDGSLEEGGVEIITAPMTYENQKKFWGTPLWEALAEQYSARSWASGNCGLHIHLSSKAFSPAQLNKFIQFYNEPSMEWLVRRVAGRWNTNFSQTRAVEKKSEYNYSPSRYRQVNLLNLSPSECKRLKVDLDGERRTSMNTVEVRAYRASLNTARILAQIDLTQAAFMYCKEASMNAITGDKFTVWLCSTPRTDYTHLKQFLFGVDSNTRKITA